jgi:hypothetical protein
VRTTRQVIDDHVVGVSSGDPVAMAVDYARGAVLQRGADRYEGHDAILEYFRTVPDRLAPGRVEVHRVETDGERGSIWWRLVGGPGDGSSGRDDLIVRDGLIVSQIVNLDGADF